MIRLIRALSISLLLLSGCKAERRETPIEPAKPRTSILLVTLDTTRADYTGSDATPSLNAFAQNARIYRHAYAAAPETLPSHTSMLTGLYPAGHGVHENGRRVSTAHQLLAERLKANGYVTAAFVSAFPLASRFGLARGFDVYDEDFGASRTERSAKETTDRALDHLAKSGSSPLFLWVHYFDAHHPYSPPEPFRSRFPNDPYRGEIAAADHELGRLLEAFRKRNDIAIIVAGDHGEGLGDHGEAQHGNLLYQSVMRVPLVVSGPGLNAGVTDEPVSTRRIFDTILDWAGVANVNSLRGATKEVVLGEAMKPFLSYGWQPQVMAVEGRSKVILAGKMEAYDVVADPREERDVAATTALSRSVRQALTDYPIPSLDAPATSQSLTAEERRQLASLGYVSSESRPVVRKDAPRPVDMAHLFETIERASALFVAERYEAAIPLLEKIVREDPHNLTTYLRLGAAHTALKNPDEALAAFRKAQELAPESRDVQHYLGMHYVATQQWDLAAPLLEKVLAEEPERLTALEAMAAIRERQNRDAEALELWRRIHALRKATRAELVKVGELAMRVGDTRTAITAFEGARQAQGFAFGHDLELGALYLEARRFNEAKEALDRVPPAHPAYAMALFKRAQVSVLLGEPDRADRIRAAKANADEVTRPLIAREKLFR